MIILTFELFKRPVRPLVSLSLLTVISLFKSRANDILLDDVSKKIKIPIGRLRMKKTCILLVRFSLAGVTAMQGSKTESLNVKLFAAIEGGHLEEIRAAIRAGGDIEALSYLDLTPLQHAVNDGRTDIVKLLLEERAQTETQAQELTSLHIAALKGRSAIVKILLEAGANPDAAIRGEPDLRGATLLHAAVSSGDEETVAHVLSHRRNREEKPESNVCCAVFSHGIESIRLWFERCMHPKSPAIHGYTPLHAAAKMGHAGVVKLLLAAGENPNAATTDGSTPLHEAAAYGHPEVIKVLEGARVNVDAPLIRGPQHGITPLHLAAHSGKVQAVIALLAAGANINAQSVDGITALLGGSFNGQDEVVRILLDAGADPNRQIRPVAPAYSPFLASVEKGHRAVAKRLLEAGAHVYARIMRGECRGHTALHRAAAQGNLDMCKLILSFLKMPASQLLEATGGRTSIALICSNDERRNNAARCILNYNVVFLDTIFASLEETNALKTFFARDYQQKIYYLS